METVTNINTLNLKSNAIAFMFAYEEQSIERMLSLCELDGEVWFRPLGDSGKGKIGELGKFLWSTLIEAFPDLNNVVDSATMEPDGDVRCQVVIRGTQAKEFAGIPNKGGSFSSDHIFVFRHNSNGKIDRIQVSWDHEDFQRQLS